MHINSARAGNLTVNSNTTTAVCYCAHHVPGTLWRFQQSSHQIITKTLGITYFSPTYKQTASKKRPRQPSETIQSTIQSLLLVHDRYPGLSVWEAPTRHATRSKSGGGHAKEQGFNRRLGTRRGVCKCFLNPLQKCTYQSAWRIFQKCFRVNENLSQECKVAINFLKKKKKKKETGTLLFLLQL